MKKVLFLALICLFAFTACERSNYPPEEEKIEPEKEIVYCEVEVQIKTYDWTINKNNFKITYDGGYGLYEGVYSIPQETTFEIYWECKYKEYDPWLPRRKTFNVASAKKLKVLIYDDEAKIVNEF